MLFANINIAVVNEIVIGIRTPS